MADNLDEVARALDELVESIRFDSAGRAGTIGNGALDILTTRITDRCRRQVDPRETPWAANKKWKDAIKPKPPIGVLTDPPDSDSMLAQVNIDGTREVEAYRATVGYGGGSEFADRKSQWFTNGTKQYSEGTELSGAKKQASRPFYEIGVGDEEALDAYFAAEFDEIVGRAR